MTGDSFYSATSYLASFQNPGAHLRDPDLRAGSVDRPLGGLPRPMDGGGFSSIFRVTSADRRRSWAVKCFLRPTDELAARYRAIEAALAGVTDFWKIEFAFDSEGLFHLPENRWVPVLKMNWVNGTPLIPWIEARLGDPAALLRMARELTKVAGALELAGIAHGDLQHGNIIVVAGDRIKLVDYDGMYVPALEGFRMPECGIRHYQPPDRDDRGYFGPAADRFSARVIRLAVRAVAMDEDLWERLHEPGGEFLILRDTDYAAPDRSEAFGLLAASADPWVRDETAQLLRDLTTHPEQIPALRPLDDTGGPTPKVAGLPEWMRSDGPTAWRQMPWTVQGSAAANTQADAADAWSTQADAPAAPAEPPSARPPDPVAPGQAGPAPDHWDAAPPPAKSGSAGGVVAVFVGVAVVVMILLILLFA